MNRAASGPSLRLTEMTSWSRLDTTAMGIGIMVWFLLAVVSSLDQLVISVNLREGPLAALFIILLDPIETTRELTVFGANLGQGQFSVSSLVALHVWKTNTYPYTFLSVCVWIAVTFVAGFLIFRHQDAA